MSDLDQLQKKRMRTKYNHDGLSRDAASAFLVKHFTPRIISMVSRQERRHLERLKKKKNETKNDAKHSTINISQFHSICNRIQKTLSDDIALDHVKQLEKNHMDYLVHKVIQRHPKLSRNWIESNARKLLNELEDYSDLSHDRPEMIGTSNINEFSDRRLHRLRYWPWKDFPEVSIVLWAYFTSTFLHFLQLSLDLARDQINMDKKETQLELEKEKIVRKMVRRAIFKAVSCEQTKPALITDTNAYQQLQLSKEYDKKRDMLRLAHTL